MLSGQPAWQLREGPGPQDGAIAVAPTVDLLVPGTDCEATLYQTCWVPFFYFFLAFFINYKRARMSLTLRLICAYLRGFNRRFRHAFMVDYMGIEI